MVLSGVVSRGWVDVVHGESSDKGSKWPWRHDQILRMYQMWGSDMILGPPEEIDERPDLDLNTSTVILHRI
jgi:hypothetical protein